MEALYAALHLSMGVNALMAVAIGSAVGLIFGAIPGLTFSMALALMLPVSFGMQPAPAMALLVGTYIGGMTGGSVSAILLGIPGTPSAAATVIDGYPLARSGRAGVALGMAVVASTFGGVFSLIIMATVSGHVANLAIQFGPAEIFALVLFGLSTICGLAEKSLLRGLIAGVIGLMLMIIGLDQLDGIPRLTFGSTDLLGGINLVVGMIGLFAVPQVIVTFTHYGRNRDRYGRSRDSEGVSGKARASLPSLGDLRRNAWLILRSAVIGTATGAIPGTGGPIAAFIAYDQARRFSKKRENYGKGEIEGIVAPEAANNAVTGGALIPLLSLGIPGDPATAVMLGGLLIHGLRPGFMLFQNNLTEVYAIYLSFFLAYIFVLVMYLFGIRLLVQVLRIPSHYMAVGILGMCAVGSYAIRNSIFDIYVMSAIGLLGYVLNRLRIPVTPVLLGLVLGPILETQYRTALLLSGGDYSIFFASIPALIFLGLTLLVIGFQIYSSLRGKEHSPVLAMGTQVPAESTSSPGAGETLR